MTSERLNLTVEQLAAIVAAAVGKTVAAVLPARSVS